MKTADPTTAYDPNVEPCPMCGVEGRVELVERERSVEVRGESFRVREQTYECGACREAFQTPGLVGALSQAYAQYRQRHNLLSPEKIREWRNELGLKQSEFAALLGWSTATVSRYENGALQDDAHDRALRAAMTADGLTAILDAGLDLSDEVKAKAKRHLAHYVHSGESLEHAIRERVGDLAGHTIQWTKTLEALAYFCQQDSVPRTKLNKLLFYADFLLQKTRGRMLTGLPYVRMQYGPMPCGSELVYSALQGLGVLDIEAIEKEDFVAYLHRSKRSARLDVFDQTELACLTYVQEHFRGWSAKAVSDYSHKEKAWLQTPQGEPIDLKFAQSLNLSLGER